ncbi:MAG: histidine kinase [Bacteroidetes bacterium]|nr:histidine kinase [Bacteroidota bacterium]
MQCLRFFNRRMGLLPALFFCLGAAAQTKCSCAEAETLRAPMGYYFNSGRLDSAVYYTQQLLQYKEGGCRIFYENWMAQLSIARKDYSAARQFLEAEKTLLNANNCKELLVRHYNTLSKLYQELNRSDSFVTACLQGIDAAIAVNDQYGLSRAYTDVASAFSQLAQREKAIAYYRKGLEAAHKQKKVPSLSASVGVRLGNEYLDMYTETNNSIFADSALQLGKSSLDTAQAFQDMLAYMEANELLASHALATRQYQSAISFADEIIRQSPRGVHLFDRITYTGFSKKSKACYQLQHYKAAEQYADSALVYATAFNPQLMIGAYNDLYLAAKANGNPSRSLLAHERMTVIRDSLFSVEKNAAINELEKKYNQAKNETTIKDLDRKKQLYLLLAIIGAVAAVAIGLYVRQQSLQHKKNILETEQRLNRARMNPHFFFNALTALQKFAVRENDGQALASNLSKFSHIMRETLESTYKDYVTIEQEMEFLNEYLEVQKIRFPQTFSYDISASPDMEIDELQIPSMIIQPFVENSIEHGFAGLHYPGRVLIQFAKDDKEILIRISDNGKGLDTVPREENAHISRASQIIRDRIYLLNIKLKTKAGFSIANNETGEGVVVKIHLPLMYKKL